MRLKKEGQETHNIKDHVEEEPIKEEEIEPEVLDEEESPNKVLV